jgi:hypothetical protein
MDPITLTLVAAGIGMQAFGGYQASKARAAQDRENAHRARMLADDALQRGEEKAGIVELASSRRQASQVAGYAHANIDPTSGSAARVVSTTAMIGALDAAIVRNNAYREAWGYELTASSLDVQAKREDRAALFSLFGAVFGGAGQLAAMAGPSGAPSPAGWSDTMPMGGTDYYGQQGYM